MNFLKSLFKEDDSVIGLCSFRKKTPKQFTFTTQQSAVKLIYSTDFKNNFLLS